MINKRKVGAVILAAGYSSRMEKFKPLMLIGEKTAAERVIDSARLACVDDIVLVTGYDREKLIPVIKKSGIKEAYNPNFDKGMFTSIKAGIEALRDELDGFFIIPVDCPLVMKETFEMLVSESPEFFTVPTYMGKKGHPIYVPMIYKEEIIKSESKNGLKAIVDIYGDKLILKDSGSESVVIDMDTNADYRDLLEYYREGCRETDLCELADGRRFIFVRHGKTEQHKEKIFLGQTDIPMSQKGTEQVEIAAFEISRLKPMTSHVYSSDLKRAAETAEIICGMTAISAVIYEKDFREMSLGEWDGKFISSIKERYPKEYEKRGKDIFRYKFDHTAENFFDLQYRVIKRLKKILEQDHRKDIVITAHSGVIRVIENNLKGLDVSDEWEALENGGVRVIEMPERKSPL